MLPNRCIILASGASIREGLPLGLSNYLDKEVVFSINDNIKFISSTIVTVGDWTAYRDRFSFYKHHPLVIGIDDPHYHRNFDGAMPCPKQDDLILLKTSGKWNGEESLSKGLYSAKLTGMFTLHLAIRLGFKQIFLLGYDCNAIGKSTHWYDTVESAGQYFDYEGKPRTGVGFYDNGEFKTSFYNNSDEIFNADWKLFEAELNNCMIYNVSLGSRINVFQKIGYQSMFTILNSNPIEVNQEEVQKEIRQLLNPYNKANN